MNHKYDKYGFRIEDCVEGRLENLCERLRIPVVRPVTNTTTFSEEHANAIYGMTWQSANDRPIFEFMLKSTKKFPDHLIDTVILRIATCRDEELMVWFHDLLDVSYHSRFTTIIYDKMLGSFGTSIEFMEAYEKLIKGFTQDMLKSLFAKHVFIDEATFTWYFNKVNRTIPDEVLVKLVEMNMQSRLEFAKNLLASEAKD